MNIDIREKISRIKCIFERLKYNKKRQFYIAVFILIFLIVSVFSAVVIYQRKDISKKENILKSYYTEDKDEYNPNLDDDGMVRENPDLSIKDTDKNKSDQIKDTLENDHIKVYICGYVNNPGVYEVRNDSRIIDVLSLAGGPKEEACLEAVNLAEKVADCLKIYIPSVDEMKKGESILFKSDNTDIDHDSKIININNATTKELENLPGIGPVTAQNIISYRDSNGLFKAKEQLKNVEGIGDKKFKKIEQLITI